jgi:hypothetical protein
MPVEKFRDISEMGPLPVESDPEKILQKIAFVWSMASLAPKNNEPRGLQKFGSILEANEARQGYLMTRQSHKQL